MPTAGGGGLERLMLLLAEGFVQDGWDVDLLLAQATGSFLTSVPQGVRVLDLRAHRSPRTILTAVPLVRYFRRERPHVLLAALPNAVVPALIARRFFMRGRVPVIARQDTTYSLERRTPRFKARIMYRLLHHLLPSADAVIACSEGAAEDLRRNVPKAAHLVRTVLNPVTHDGIGRQAAEPSGHPWLADPYLSVVLTVGRLVLAKDHPTLVRAFAQVARSRPSTRLVVVGQGPERERTMALAAELGIADAVDFPGFVDNPYSYMAEADVFAISSTQEGLPTVLIEAMACGTTVVSTDCPSGPDEILQGGKWGRLTPVGDEQALTAAILDALDNPTDASALKARAADFAVAPAIAQHVSIAREVMESFA